VEGMRTKACLECLARFADACRYRLVPFVYSALLEAYGHERFVADAHAAGAGAILVPDLPVDSHPELERIQLVAPTSTTSGFAWQPRRRTAGSTWSA